MTNKKSLSDEVNAIGAAIRALPAGKSDSAIRYLDSVLEAKQILEFAPKIGRDLIRIFEDHHWLQSFNVWIKWEFEKCNGEYDKVYSYENMEITAVDSQRNEQEIWDLEWKLLEAISYDTDYRSLHHWPDMVCAAVGWKLASSREIYDRLNLAGELTPMNMYIESAKEKYEELVAQMSEPYEGDDDEPVNTPERPRG